MTRLVHVTTTDMSLELLLGPQLRAFQAAGYEVHTASAPGPYVAGLEADGIVHHPLAHSTRAMAPSHDLRAFGEVRRLFRRLEPAIVHTHNPKPGVFGRLGARAARVPVVVNTVHGLYATPTDRLRKRAVVYGLERVAAACSDAELVQNPEDIPVLRRLHVPAAKIQLLGNGIDLHRFGSGAAHPSATTRAAVRAELGIADDDVVCGTVGRLVVEKGVREVFDAAGLLAGSHPKLRFLVVGPTDTDKADAIAPDELRRAAETGVILAGERSDVERLYRAMDIFVIASWREGFPRAAMEAAASGLPIVATDIRGCRQVVDHERTGLLLPVRDASALAAAVAQLADDEGSRVSMGEAARDKAEAEFDDRRVIELTLATYARLLAAAGLDAPGYGGQVPA